MKSLRLVALAPILLTALVLGGCTPTAPVPTASPGGTPVAVSTPTPTPSAAALPVIRVQTTCSDLFAASDIATLVQDTHVALRDDGTGSPANIIDIAARQRGLLTCTWGGVNRTDTSYDQGLRVTIVPDAAAEFATNLPNILAAFAPAVKNTAGDKSAYNCQIEDPGFSCNAEMLVGTDWVGLTLQNDGSTPFTSSAVKTKIQTVLTTLATKVRATPASLPAWPIPDATIPPFCSSSTGTSKLRSIFGSPHLEKNGDSPVFTAEVIPLAEPTYDECDWSGGGTGSSHTQFVGVSILEGGSWALPGLASTLPTVYSDGHYAAVTVPGATDALLACGEECLLSFSVGDDAYEVDFDNTPSAKTPATLAAVVAVVSAS